MNKDLVVLNLAQKINDDVDLNNYVDEVMLKNFWNIRYDDNNDDGVYYMIRQSIINDIVVLALSKSMNIK